MLVIKIVIIIKIIKMILTTKVTVIITIIIKCSGRYRTPTTTNNGPPCGITEWSKAFK